MAHLSVILFIKVSIVPVSLDLFPPLPSPLCFLWKFLTLDDTPYVDIDYSIDGKLFMDLSRDWIATLKLRALHWNGEKVAKESFPIVFGIFLVEWL